MSVKLYLLELATLIWSLRVISKRHVSHYQSIKLIFLKIFPVIYPHFCLKFPFLHFFIGSFFILLLANKPFIVTLLDKKKEHFDKEEKEKKRILTRKKKGLDHANLSRVFKKNKKMLKNTAAVSPTPIIIFLESCE